MERAVVLVLQLLAFSDAMKVKTRLQNIGQRQVGDVGLPVAHIPAGTSPRSGTESDLSEVFHDLWSGMDVGLPATYRESLGNEVLNESKVAHWNGKYLQILGMFDAGTNLLGALLEANLGKTQMRNLCPDDCCPSKDYHCLFWKHTPPQFIETELKKAKLLGKKVVTVVMVRSPLAQISGWKKAPYDLARCLKQTNWFQDHKAVCELWNPKVAPWERQTFAGTTGVWNDYVKEYHRLADSTTGLSDKTIVVGYEELVLDPEKVFREIAGALGLEGKTPFEIIDSPAKAHGSASGRDKAIQNINDMEYMRLDPMTKEGVPSALCSHLNVEDLRRHTIPTIPNERSYEADCTEGAH